MFIWAQLSSQVNTAELLPKAAAEGVLFVPGRPFFATHPKVNYLRLSFATQTPEEIEEGVRRLARAIVD
jgi:DNA-binding transcriptional MocR family regulator